MRAGDHPRVTAVTGPGSPWSVVHHLDEVSSTHDDALARLKDGEVAGVVVVADRQTRGRGRAGRGWEDGPGPESSLMLTATVRAPSGAVTLAPLAAGLALADAVDHLDLLPEVEGVGERLRLKWPNDVMVDDRKCAGILVERHLVDDPNGGEPVDVLLLGIGTDVDWRGTDRTGERAAWTSLAEAREGDVDRFALLGALLEALARRVAAVDDAPSALLADYRRRCLTLGQDVEAQGVGGSAISGFAVDVDDAGRLLVDTGRERIAITAGDVTLLRSDT